MTMYNYKNILVLASGGMLGAAWHLATLKRMVENGEIKLEEYDLIIGTSAGSLAASLAFSSISLEDGLKILDGEEIEFKNEKMSKPKLNYSGDIRRDSRVREYYKYLLKNKKFPKLGFFLTNLISTGDSTLEPLAEAIDKINENKWPSQELWIISSSITTNSRVIINRESGVPLGASVVSSCSIPGLYKPNRINNHDLLDGGIISSHSLDLAIKNNPSKITILAPLSTFSRVSRSKTLVSNVISVIRTYEEVVLRLYSFIAAIKKIEIKIIRPRKNERRILTQGVMDESKLNLLISETLKNS